MAQPIYCTDNAAMVGTLATWRIRLGATPTPREEAFGRAGVDERPRLQAGASPIKALELEGLHCGVGGFQQAIGENPQINHQHRTDPEDEAGNRGNVNLLRHQLLFLPVEGS